MKKNSMLVFMLLICSITISCRKGNDKKVEDKIWIVGQPQLEISKSVIIKFFFKKKPDSGSINVKFNNEDTDYDFDGDDIEKSLQYDGAHYYYDLHFQAGKLGKSTLPNIEAKIGGMTYNSAPFIIDVVKKQQVDSDAVKLSLTANKTRYESKDTITIALLEHSRFSATARFTPDDLVKKGAPEALFSIIAEGNVDYKVGISGFKALIDSNFKVLDFDWNVNELGKRMVSLNQQSYIEQRIFEMKLIAKRKGKFTIPSSRFAYKIYPYKEAFKEELLAQKDELRTKNRIPVKSNALAILVE